MPPLKVGTVFQTVLPVADCSVTPVSWFAQSATLATASKAQSWCSVTWSVPLIAVQSPVFRVGGLRRLSPPSSLSNSELVVAWNAIARESAWGEVLPVVWLPTIHVHCGDAAPAVQRKILAKKSDSPSRAADVFEGEVSPPT